MTLSFWTLALRPMFDGYIKGQIALFEAANPGVKVDWVDVPYDALERKLIAAAAAGRAPDVVNMADLNFARFVSLGAFREIGPDLPGDPQKQYLPGALSLCVIRGQTLAVPWYVNPQALLVNTGLLAKGGLTVETVSPTWSGLVEQAREFHFRTGAYLFSQPLGEESQLPIMILGEGLDPLRASASGGLEANMASPEMERYLGRFVSLYRDGGLPREAATKGHAHLTEMFQDGRVAAISTGPNFLKRIKDVAPGVFKDTVVLPGAVGALGRVHLPVMILAVTTQSKHPAHAAKLAWAMTGPEAQTEFCKHAAIMPSSTASLNDPFFEGKGDSETDPKLLSARRVAAQTLREAVAFTASLETWPDLRRAFEDEFKRVLLGERDLRPALVEIDRLWRGILAAAPRATMDAIPRPSVVAPPARRFEATSA
ncbi:MAG: extracellular solute-binding protein [Planctomycetes bacterium]|nr:extracellular solute-binding protein [Planctomycetota bacterium]